MPLATLLVLKSKLPFRSLTPWKLVEEEIDRRSGGWVDLELVGLAFGVGDTGRRGGSGYQALKLGEQRADFLRPPSAMLTTWSARFALEMAWLVGGDLRNQVLGSDKGQAGSSAPRVQTCAKLLEQKSTENAGFCVNTLSNQGLDIGVDAAHGDLPCIPASWSGATGPKPEARIRSGLATSGRASRLPSQSGNRRREAL